MDKYNICKIYNEEYAISYDQNFLLGPYFIECTKYEVGLLKKLLENSQNWLDIGCGTGYFLSQFKDIERAGLDIAPAMLKVAQKANPGIQLIEADFRNENPELKNKWDLVSCMWYAYCYASTIQEVEQILLNMISWTSIGGNCFIPFCNPNVLCKTNVPFKPPPDSDDGILEVTAVIWNWIDLPTEIKHIGLIAPHLDFIKNLFSESFEEVKLVDYPTFNYDVLEKRSAILAYKKIK